MAVRCGRTHGGRVIGGRQFEPPALSRCARMTSETRRSHSGSPPAPAPSRSPRERVTPRSRSSSTATVTYSLATRRPSWPASRTLVRALGCQTPTSWPCPGPRTSEEPLRRSAEFGRRGAGRTLERRARVFARCVVPFPSAEQAGRVQAPGSMGPLVRARCGLRPSARATSSWRAAPAPGTVTT